MLYNKTVKKWEAEDFRKVLTLRSLSPKAYHYLRVTVNLPLPFVTSLNKCLSRLNVEPGLLLSVIQVLQHKAASMTDFERLCV